jgi:hypothetical protein
MYIFSFCGTLNFPRSLDLSIYRSISCHVFLVPHLIVFSTESAIATILLQCPSFHLNTKLIQFSSNSTYSICCGFVEQPAVRLVVKLWICREDVDLLYSFSICCGQVESHTPLFRFAVDLL